MPFGEITLTVEGCGLWRHPKTVAEGQAKGGECYHAIKFRGPCVKGKREWTGHMLVTLVMQVHV